MVEKKKTKPSSLDIPTNCDYPDVFPEELLRLPPQREIEFEFTLFQVPLRHPTPYRMASVELKELKLQLQ